MLDTDILLRPFLVTGLIGLTTFLLLLWYSIKSLDYWKKRNIPFVKSYPFVGSLLSIFVKPFHEVELDRYLKHGRLYGHFEGNRPLLSVGDPALLRDILVKDFQFFSSRRSFQTGDKLLDSMLTVVKGEDWKRIRTIITPTFTTGKIKRMTNIFNECSTTLVSNFETMSKIGPIDMKRVYGAYTMDVIASSAFSTKLDSHNDPDNAFVRTARQVFSRTVNWRMLLFFTVPWFMKFFKISIMSPTAINFFRNATLQIIAERRRTGQTRNDFLQLMMDTAKELTDEQKLQEVADATTEDLTSNYGDDGTSHEMFKSTAKKNMSMDELVAQCIIFFLAGYDTTASTLAFATYNLALRPEVQEKVHQEVVQALEQTNGEMTYEAVQNMKYLDNVISETLRLYPPLPRLERLCEADYKLGDTGLTVQKGIVVTIPNYAIQRDPKLFPDPETFNPDRFELKDRLNRDPYTFLPFGAGPRNCVSMRFALMEVKVCLARVIATFKINKCSSTQVPLIFQKSQGLLMPKEILLEMELRENRPHVQ